MRGALGRAAPAPLLGEVWLVRGAGSNLSERLQAPTPADVSSSARESERGPQRRTRSHTNRRSRALDSGVRTATQAAGPAAAVLAAGGLRGWPQRRVEGEAGRRLQRGGCPLACFAGLRLRRLRNRHTGGLLPPAGEHPATPVLAGFWRVPWPAPARWPRLVNSVWGSSPPRITPSFPH